MSTGSPDLSRWPLLAWLPDKGVVTRDKHIPIARIVKMDDIYTRPQIAAELGITTDDVTFCPH
jgi:hypothetical protein